MKDRIKKIIARSSKDGKALWRYFRHGDTKRDRLRRARNILFAARHRQQAAARRAKLAQISLDHHPDASHEWKEKQRKRRDRATKAAERWGKFRPVYKAQVRRIRKKIKKGDAQPTDWQPWMASGNSWVLCSAGTLEVAAFAVTQCGATVTDFYDFGGHASGSFHYPRNNPDGKCHAADLIPATCTLMTQIQQKFGASFFKELFGPCGHYFKSGVEYPGMFPGHGTHTHAAPVT